MGTWKIGCAKRCVTPPPGVALAGYGLKPERKVGAVLDDLYARALVFDDGRRKAALLSVEIIGVSAALAESVARRIEQQAGIPREAVLLSATHTHSSPTAVYLRHWGEMDPGYVGRVEEQLVAAACAADKNPQPAALGNGQAQVPGVAVNRVHQDGPVDHTLRFLGARRTEDRKLLAAALNFSCHPVCMRTESTFVSADYPGRMLRDLERAFPGLEPAFFQGSAGDINPQHLFGGVDRAQDHGRLLGEAARQGLEGLAFREEGTLAYSQCDCQLPLDWDDARREASEFLSQGRIRKNHELLAKTGFLSEWAQGILGRIAAGPADQLRCRLGALRLGDLAVVGCPGEIETLVANTIRAESPFPETWVLGYAGGDVGYITDPREYAEETYEAVLSPKIYDQPPFRPEAWRSMADAAKNCLQALL